MVDFDLWPLWIRTTEKRICPTGIKLLSLYQIIYIFTSKTRSQPLPGVSSSPPLCHPHYHAGHTPAQEHVPEAECAAAAIRPGVGTHAAALYCAAASPSEQR